MAAPKTTAKTPAATRKTQEAPARARASAPNLADNQESFVYDGVLDNVPDWVDKGWATYSSGPALAVPNGDPYGQPYTTTVARIGDTVICTRGRGDDRRNDRFKVVRAEEMGEQPGGDRESTLPAQTTAATLEDLDKTGALPKEEMDVEQQAQMEARQTTSGAAAAPPSDTTQD